MMESKWRLICSGPLKGSLNMALDEALLEEVAAGRSEAVLRIYRWFPAAVSLGYGQRGKGAVNLEACRALGLDVVRRMTGGRAVLHHREVTYSVIAPESSSLFPGGILENYKVIAQVLQKTLASFGIPATLASGRRRGSGNLESACFTAPASYELVYRGCKMTGSAQRRQGSAFLQHGSIPVDLDLSHLYQALNTKVGACVAEGTRRLGEKVGWMNRWLPLPVTVEAVERRLLEVFADQWRLGLREVAPSDTEMARALALQAEKYESSRWTLEGKV